MKSLGQKFTDPSYLDWATKHYSPRELHEMSKLFSGFLRHYGCIRKGGLSCDSGGWFLWRDLMQLLSGNGYTRCHHAECFRTRKYWGNNHVGIYMMRAMIPMDRATTRFQVLIEIDHETGEWIRPAAGRACSGHADWALLDPARIAGNATPDLLRTLPGLFHITTPGHELSRRGRVDIHFSPFPPLDPRNGMMFKKMEQIRRAGELGSHIH